MIFGSLWVQIRGGRVQLALCLDSVLFSQSLCADGLLLFDCCVTSDAALFACCRWQLDLSRMRSQQQLLTAIQCHCMQVLAQAHEQLAPAACMVGSCRSSSSSSQDAELQLQRQAWRQCVSVVQHNVLLVLQLTKQWKQHNALGALERLLRRNT